MIIGKIKLKVINKMLKLLGFSSVAFVFTACYGTKPCDYREETADSLSVAFSRAASDSVEVTQQPVADALDDTATNAR